MWGARARKSRRRLPIREHTFENIRENVHKMPLRIQHRVGQKRKRLRGEIVQLDLKIKRLPCGDRNVIHERADLNLSISKLNKQLVATTVERQLQAFAEQANPLVTKNTHDNSHVADTQRHALYLSLFSNKSVPCYVNSDVCADAKCRHELVRSADSKVNCTKCGASTAKIFCVNDYTHIAPAEKHPYKRDTLYLKFVMQYEESVKEIPEEVLDLVYGQLSKVHLMLRSRTKPTPISQILRDAGHKKWVMFAPRWEAFLLFHVVNIF